MPISPRTRLGKHYVTPFPKSISRDAFGWYISGFTDGEGCFSLLLDGRNNAQSYPSASFAINLRRDDEGILKLIQSYFKCGKMVYNKTRRLCSLRYRTLDELAVIVEHFDEFNLFAKKKADFDIWRKGVLLILYVAERKQVRSQRYGSSYKWRPEEHKEFVALKNSLSEVRKFKVVNEKNNMRNSS